MEKLEDQRVMTAPVTVSQMTTYSSRRFSALCDLVPRDFKVPPCYSGHFFAAEMALSNGFLTIFLSSMRAKALGISSQG